MTSSHAAKPFVRAVRTVSILGLAFSACLCAGESGASPASAAPPAAETQTGAPRAADTSPPEAAPAASPAPAAPEAASARSASPRCENYVAVLSGRKKDPAALADRKLQAIATADLVMCGAVFSDSDELCKRLMPVEKGPSAACLRMRSLFNELRTYPDKPSFMFDEVTWQECREIPALTEFCDSLQRALRSGEPKDCDGLGDGASMCRAYMTRDKALCKITGKLAQVEVSLPDRKEGEPAKTKAKDGLEKRCQESIDSLAFLAKGLPEVAASGPPLERELAKAALKQPDACETYAQEARKRCDAPPPQSPAASAGQTPAAPGAGGAAPAKKDAPRAVPKAN